MIFKNILAFNFLIKLFSKSLLSISVPAPRESHLKPADILNSKFRGGSGIFLRRGSTKFFLQNTSCIRKPTRHLMGVGGGGGAHPVHHPPRSAPEIIDNRKLFKRNRDVCGGYVLNI